MIGSFDETRREATVIGAGIAGLLAAYALDRQGYEVTLLEGAARAGGLIQTRRNAYGIAETAAHSLLITPQVAADRRSTITPPRTINRKNADAWSRRASAWATWRRGLSADSKRDSAHASGAACA